MSKEKVLEMLRASDDFISGQKLADELKVSRNSVWKYVKALQEDGYEIFSQTRLGYRLDKSTEHLSAPEILRLNDVSEKKLIVLKEIDSTNSYLKKNHDTLEDRTVVVTDHQLSGRGRYGRSFYSPKGSGLYFSVLYKGSEMPEPEYLTIAAALAVSDVVSHLGLDPKIKWVNDIYIDQRKICGILTECEVELESASMKYLILGIGINVNNESFPAELQKTAGSLQMASGRSFNLNEVCADLLNSVESYTRKLVRKPDLEEQYQDVTRTFISRYNDRLLYKGDEITLSGGNQQEITGILLGTDSHGHLLVRTEDGIQKAVYGEYRLNTIFK